MIAAETAKDVVRVKTLAGGNALTPAQFGAWRKCRRSSRMPPVMRYSKSWRMAASRCLTEGLAICWPSCSKIGSNCNRLYLVKLEAALLTPAAKLFYRVRIGRAG